MKMPPDEPELAARYAMALDLMGDVAGLATEDEVAAKLFQMFEITCGATRKVWIPLDASGRPAAVRWEPAGAAVAELPAAIATEARTRTFGLLDDGFWLRIGRDGEVLGVLVVAGPRILEWRDRYLNFGLGIVDVCALAVRNARSWERVIAAEAGLATERERLAVTLHSIAEGVVATDLAGRVLLCNRVFSELTGWAEGEGLGGASGRPLPEVFPVADEATGKAHADPAARVLATGKVVVEARGASLTGRDGKDRLVAYTASPIRSESGRVEGVVLVVRDIAEQRALEREAVRASKLASLGLLAGGIAHDFNNLIAVVLGNLTLARELTAPGEEIGGLLEEAEEALQATRGLTRQLLTFAEGGSLDKQVADTAGLIRKTVDYSVRGAACALEVELPEDLWAIEVDAGQIGQVLNNLVLNAVQAMSGGGTLRVSARNLDRADGGGDPLPPGPYVEIAVADDGPGIAPCDLEHIFDPFFTTKASGTGLGLATSYSIVKRHQGAIRVQSAPGQGTRFDLLLPATRSPAPQSPEPSPARGGAGRLLVMDDDPRIRALLCRMLGRAGYQVVATSDGAEAIAAWKEARAAGHPFDCLILDLTVPGGLGGAEVLAAVRAEDPQARVIASTGYAVDEHHAEGRGFSAMVPKPYTPAVLRATVARVLAA